MKRFKPVTQRDIARELGLSVSTVSRALNDVYGVKDDTKKLVLDYVKQIEYYPNPMALKLKDRCSHSIGVIVSEVANSYFSQVINGIESVAYDNGYQIMITQTHESSQREIANIKQLISQSVDGILISLSSETQDMNQIRYLQDMDVPVVFFDRVPQDVKADKVIVNNYKGAFDATEHLIESGYRKIAHLTNSGQLLLNRERLEGYKAALAKHNIPFNPGYVFYCDYDERTKSEVENVVNRLMNLHERPEAIFSAGDRLSIECIQALNRLGFKIPEDIAFVGFTNIGEINMLKFPIATVSQPAFEIGQIATEMLIKQIESRFLVTKSQTRILTTELNIYEICK